LFFDLKKIYSTVKEHPEILAQVKASNSGGAERDRTADPLLAKQVLSQLSYSPNRLMD
jgi:hypothetical protein